VMHRIQTYLEHISPSPVANKMSGSLFEAVQAAPVDPIFGIQQAFVADPAPKKFNFGVGAYRTDEGKPLVLKTVKKVEQSLLDNNVNKEYIEMQGEASFLKTASKLILGDNSPAIAENRVVPCQALGGTGALRLGFEFLKRFYPGTRTVLIPEPTWANHKQICDHVGIAWSSYRYYDDKNRSLDLQGFLEDLNNAADGSIVLLHAVAHNPTGMDPTPDQWKEIANVMIAKKHFSFFDCAYQGFASGDLASDAAAVQYFASLGLELFVAQSFSKNFGLYSERIGCLTMLLASPEVARVVETQIRVVVRGMYSNPPAHGARIVGAILSDPNLFKEWEEELIGMANRLKEMRQRLYDEIVKLGTPGDWTHICKQIGMFSYLGLTAAQVSLMREKYHVYMTSSARISIAGLNSSNVAYLAEAINFAVTNQA